MTLTLHKSQVTGLVACSYEDVVESASLPANSQANFSTVALCCVTMTLQQIFEDALQVTVVRVLPHVTTERKHLDRQCSERVTADNKPCTLALYQWWANCGSPTYFVWLF